MAKRQTKKRAKTTRKKMRGAMAPPITQPAKDQDGNTFLFKDGLYYPFIDVQDEGWLKSAVLYWDTLSTIVPEHYSSHRQSETAAVLADANVLRAEHVAPGMRELDETAEECVTFLDSPEGMYFLQSSQRRGLTPRHQSWHPEAIHHGKIMHMVIDELRHRGLPIDSHGNWYRVPGWFARYYMTILASRLARMRGHALLTDDPAVEPLANSSMRGAAVDRAPAEIAEGLLASFVLRTVHIAKETSVEKVLGFRDKHRDELGRLKTALRGLVDPIKGKPDIVLLRKHLETIYTDQVLPAINDVRGRLRDNRIACGYNNLKASTLLSASPTALGAALATAGLGPFALLGGVGISLALSVGNYQLQRRELLRSSPYSYVLLAEKKMGKRNPSKRDL